VAHRSETAAGGVVFRRSGSRIEVALGEQRDRLTGAATVRLPKGKLDRGESPEQAALREVREETGLAARVVAPLGDVSYVYRDGRGEVAKQVRFFLLELVAAGAGEPDGEFGRVVWCPLEDAEARLTFEPERQMVGLARAALERA
jgi:8-oxo-dGTP pyrophosphatase MutT (NUDIX family)